MPPVPQSLLPLAARQQLLGPEEGERACVWPLGDWSLRGSLGRRLSEEGHGLARGPWLDNSGKRGQTRRPALGCPRARHQSGPEARIKAGDFAADSTQGLGVKSMISYFSILDQKMFVCGVLLLICRAKLFVVV